MKRRELRGRVRRGRREGQRKSLWLISKRHPKLAYVYNWISSSLSE